MDTTADSRDGAAASNHRSHEQRSLPLRVALACVTGAGAFAIVWAGIISGGRASVMVCAAAGVLSVLSAILWEVRPSAGRWALGAVGAAGGIVSGAALVTGDALPWVLVAFWGSVAVLLAALLDFVVGAARDRSGTIAVVAVATLLFLSALGMGEYVRITWSQTERAILEHLPVFGAAMSQSSGAATGKTIQPVDNGQWGETWTNLARDPNAEFASMRQALLASGWVVTEPASGQLVANRNGVEVEVYETVTPSTGGLASVRVSVHVGEVGGETPTQ